MSEIGERLNMKIVVGHSCPICYSTHLSTHRYEDIIIVECDKCKWQGEFEELNEDCIDVEVIK